MWKSQTTTDHNLNQNHAADDDDWETDPDFINDVSEKEQRYTSKTIPAASHNSGRDAEKIDLQSLQKQVIDSHESKKKQEWQGKNDFSKGYGGKFGLQNTDQDAQFLDNKRASVGNSQPKYKTTVTLPESHKEGLNSIRQQFQQKINDSTLNNDQSNYTTSRSSDYSKPQQPEEPLNNSIPPPLMPKPERQRAIEDY